MFNKLILKAVICILLILLLNSCNNINDWIRHNDESNLFTH